jgi:hypothetical protein
MPRGGVYSYSFSGADITNVSWIALQDSNRKIFNSAPVVLDTMTTISFSLHESKSPVRSLGRRSVNGYTSAIRTIAGTMIFNIIDQHPLYQLITEYAKLREFGIDRWGYSRDIDRDGSGYINIGDAATHLLHPRIFPTMLPPFNIIFVASTEVDMGDVPFADTAQLGPTDFAAATRHQGKRIGYATWALFGVELIDDNFVASVNNILTEQTYSFVCTDAAVLEFRSSPPSADQLQLLAQSETSRFIDKLPPANDVDSNLIHQLEALKVPTITQRITSGPNGEVFVDTFSEANGNVEAEFLTFSPPLESDPRKQQR